MSWKQWLARKRNKTQTKPALETQHGLPLELTKIIEKAKHEPVRINQSNQPPDKTAKQQAAALGSSAVLALINQRWMTPLSHIRSAIDALGRIDQPTQGGAGQIQRKQQHNDSLALLQNASYQLRASIENIIDYHEIIAGRLSNTPGPLRPCSLGEELVSNWQGPAQRAGHLLVFAGDQDVPDTVSLDPELTHRLFDRLTGMLLATPDIREPAICCSLVEQSDADFAKLAISFDGKPDNPESCLLDTVSKLATPLPDELQTLLEENTIDIWIVQKLATLLGASMFIGPTQKNLGRYGIRLELTVPIKQACASRKPILAEKRVAVATQSDIQARALRSQLVSLGAFIVPVDEKQAKPDIIFVDKAGWARISKQVEFGHWHDPKPLTIGLVPSLNIRGRPRYAHRFADFNLPGFIPTRALEKSLHRILNTDIEQRREARARRSKQQYQFNPNDIPQSTDGKISKKKVGTALIVDDDPIYLAHLSRLLGPMGFELRTASSGKEAMSCADANRIDVVLTDMHMPDITGAGVGRMLRRHPRYRDIPILAVTANRQSAVHQDLRAAGIQQVLTKPVSASELQAALSPFFDLSPACTLNPPAPEHDPFLIQLLREELPSYLAQLQDPRADLDKIRHAAHKLRGAAGCCQHTELKNRAERLEKAITANKSEDQIRADKQALIEYIIDLQQTLKHTKTQKSDIR